MKPRTKRKKLPAPPALGRNLALRPGGGAHTPEGEKRAAEKRRREIEEQREISPE